MSNPAPLPPLHSLTAFEAVARLGSLARAARELGLTRSALSQSIGLLEHRLGVSLFVRLAPEAAMTPAGRLYHDAVKRFGAVLHDRLYDLSDAARLTLRISVPPGFSRLWLAPRLVRFRERHPRIDVVAEITESRLNLDTGRVDLAVRFTDVVPAGVQSHALWSEVIVALGTPALAARSRDQPIDAVVREQPLIEHPEFRWSNWLPEANGPAPTLVAHDILVALEAAERGFGIVLSPLHLAAPRIAEGKLARLHAHERPGKGYVVLVPDAAANRPAVIAFVAWLLEEVAAQP